MISVFKEKVKELFRDIVTDCTSAPNNVTELLTVLNRKITQPLKVSMVNNKIREL